MAALVIIWGRVYLLLAMILDGTVDVCLMPDPVVSDPESVTALLTMLSRRLGK